MRSVSIVIPSWNGKEILERNLPSVKTALESYPGGGEVIVVDDGSRDETVSWLRARHPGVRAVARHSQEGFGAAVNAGAASARGDLVVLLNNDMRVESDFLEPLTAPFSSVRGLFSTTPRIVNRTFGGDEAVTGCSFRRGLFDTLFPRRGEAAAAAPAPDEAGAPVEVVFACGGAAVYDRSLWVALCGLDPLYAPFYWEDVDLSWRARKRGWSILHVPQSVVHHEHSATIGARFDARQVRIIYERNRLLFQWKNLTSRRLTAKHALWLGPRIAWGIAGRGEFLRGFAAALGRRRPALAARRLEKAKAVVTDEQILLRFTSGEAPATPRADAPRPDAPRRDGEA